jgi:hypothetical protein
LSYGIGYSHNPNSGSMTVFKQSKSAFLTALVALSAFFVANSKTTFIAQGSNENPNASSAPRQHSNDTRTDSYGEHGSSSDNVKAPNQPQK